MTGDRRLSLVRDRRASGMSWLASHPQWLFGALTALGILVFAGGSYLIGDQAKRELLLEDATTSAEMWGQTLARHIDDLAPVLAGAEPSEDTRRFLAKAKEMGGIFRYKLFDRSGRLRFTSDDQKWGGGDDRTLAEHNPRAASTVASGQAFASARNGDGISRPKVFASTYAPIVKSGETIGVLEVYVDHTKHAHAISHDLAAVGLKIMALTAVGFLLPMLGFIWQARRRDQTVQQLDHAVRHDELTGVINRSAFADAVSALADSGERFAVHFVDLDHFKKINDTRGHAAGDRLLKEAARRLKEVVGPANAVARLGGDEFAVLQALRSEQEGAAAGLGARIAASLRTPFQIGEHPVQIGGSVGVALHPDHGRRVNELLKAADIALYVAKGAGRGQCVLFHGGLEEERRLRQQLEDRLRQAAGDGDFEMHFQPLYEAMTGKLRGFEALLRLRAADGSLIPPSVFIPLAEELKLIDRIGAWVLREACRTAAAWPTDLSVAVNLSPLQFDAGDLYEIVEKVLADTGLAPERLELEVTESLLLTDVEGVIDQLNALKMLGVLIALDDFGTGYSSLSYLWRFPFDKLKVDRSFMAGLDDEKSKSREVLDTIVALGRVLNLKVTAEGVETQAQADVLRSLNCDLLQGFLYGRPMPAIEVAAAILASKRREWGGGDERRSVA
jgi:diguanylate cyclase (GGDEF)-like protein